MTKSAKSKRTSGRRPAKPKTAIGKATKVRNSTRGPVQRNRATSTQQVKPAEAGHDSKQAHLIALLRLPAGASIAAMMNATGWQQHSVRGFLAGVVRKKLRLKLTSEKLNGQRIYRIVASGGSRLSNRQSKQLSA